MVKQCLLLLVILSFSISTKSWAGESGLLRVMIKSYDYCKAFLPIEGMNSSRSKILSFDRLVSNDELDFRNDEAFFASFGLDFHQLFEVVEDGLWKIKVQHLQSSSGVTIYFEPTYGRGKRASVFPVNDGSLRGVALLRFLVGSKDSIINAEDLDFIKLSLHHEHIHLAQYRSTPWGRFLHRLHSRELAFVPKTWPIGSHREPNGRIAKGISQAKSRMQSKVIERKNNDPRFTGARLLNEMQAMAREVTSEHEEGLPNVAASWERIMEELASSDPRRSVLEQELKNAQTAFAVRNLYLPLTTNQAREGALLWLLNLRAR